MYKYDAISLNIRTIFLYFSDKAPPFLSEHRLNEILDICKQEDCYLLLIRTIGKIFSDSEALARSFLKETPCSPIDALLDRAPG